jgi:hypothetical protein
MYLQANGARPDVLAAVDREIEASEATEVALASDRTNKWQPFQIRGTYLSREDGVPSGPLTLYGSAHSDSDPGLKVHNVQQTPDRGVVAVQIRDLSRRFDNKDMTFAGQGETFDAALKDAFTKNAKAYPKGVMAIEAEAIEAHTNGSDATIGKGNGKTIGFEIGTDSGWKRVKAKVWSPIVNIATNLGAMALMAFVPELAPVIAPLLITYNSAPAVDRLKTESDRGTLTLGEAATSVGEIALNVLPFVGRAPVFSKGWFVIEGANWGGQAVLMAASALQIAHELQSQDVAALAALYEDLKKAEESGSDPAEIEQKREKVMERAKKVSDRIAEALKEQIATNAMFAVAGTVIHNAGTEHERGSLIDAYRRARGIAGGESGTEATDNTGANAGDGASTAERPSPSPNAEPPQADDGPGPSPGARTSEVAPATNAREETSNTSKRGDGSGHKRPSVDPAKTDIRYSYDELTVGEPPTEWNAQKKWLSDESHWVSERKQLHRELLEKAHEEASKFANMMMGRGEPTVYAMRGNTASGKTRLAKSGAMPEIEAAVRATGDGRSINPDNFKGELMRHGGFTANEVHMEASVLADKLQAEMQNEHTADGKPASMIIDKRLLGLDEIESYAKMAKDTRRKFAMSDVDTPLENSLVGVLGRKVGGNDPLVPFVPVAEGFKGARRNRADVIAWFQSHPEASYTLYGTTPDGAKVEVASVNAGKLAVNNEAMYEELTAKPGDETDVMSATIISQSSIDEIVGAIKDPKYAAQVADELKPYVGKTWKQAVDAHSKERPTSVE